MQTTRQPSRTESRPFQSSKFDWFSFFGTGATGLATLLIIAILAIIVGDVLIGGLPNVSWRFISSPAVDMFNLKKTGILPMIVGTAARVILMTILVVPVGVITAIYLTEYARLNSPFTRIVRGAVNNLAGVPSIVFG